MYTQFAAVLKLWTGVNRYIGGTLLLPDTFGERMFVTTFFNKLHIHGMLYVCLRNFYYPLKFMFICNYFIPYSSDAQLRVNV